MRSRAKEFGQGYARPLDPGRKNALWKRARELTRPTRPGKHYGALTGKQRDVFGALLWKFHNVQTGRCDPSYGAIAAEAGCCVDTVRTAIAALESAGLLTWCNRLIRVRGPGPKKVLRTSNGYWFCSDAKLPGGNKNQSSTILRADKKPATIDLTSPLNLALASLRAAVKGKSECLLR